MKKLILVTLIYPCMLNSGDVFALIRAEAIKQNINPDVALAIAKTESSFNENAMAFEKNRQLYSLGLFQLLESTASYFCDLQTKKEILNVKNNIKCGINYLKSKLERYKDVDMAILAYNAGSAIRRNGAYINEGYLRKVKNNMKSIKERNNVYILTGIRRSISDKLYSWRKGRNPNLVPTGFSYRQ